MGASSSFQAHVSHPCRRVGLPVDTDAAGGQRLSAHFGRASQVLLFDLKQGDQTVIDCISGRSGDGQCGPVDVLISFGVDAVICRSLGQGAYRRLREASITVLRTRLRTPEIAVAALEAGGLEPYPPGAGLRRT